jgi:hypothetical protein
LQETKLFPESSEPPHDLKPLAKQLVYHNFPNEGPLTEAERADLESLVELSELLSPVRAEALHLLGRKPE